jgi:hypothetical protein
MAQVDERLTTIHQEARSELKNPTGTMPLRRAGSALRALETHPHSWMWVEATVMVNILKRQRPNITLGLLARLQKNADTPQKKQEYKEIYADIVEHLKPITLNNHGYVENTFGTDIHADLWPSLKKHFDVFEAAGMKVFLNSGTLLGLIRDGKPIAHDNDIDLGIILDAKSEKKAITEWRALPDKLRALGILNEEAENPPGILQLKPVAGYQVDIFPAWSNRNKMYVFPHTYGEIKLADVFPFAQCGITGLPMPAAPEKMLAVNYGPNWHTPDPIFKFHMPSEFKPFLKQLEEAD